MAGESKLQKKIIKDLKKGGWIPLKVILCNLPGFNDIIAFKKRRAVFIEAKDEGEEAKKLQLYRHKMLLEQGFSVFVIDSWEQYLELKGNNFTETHQPFKVYPLCQNIKK